MSSKSEMVILRAFDLGSAEAAPDRILVSPWGHVKSKGQGGDFVFDAESAKAVVARFEAHDVDIPVDIEHQTLGGKFRSPDGSAPAVGWITALEPIEGEGLFASVNWTKRGRELIASKEYRYLSPVTGVRTRDNRMVMLHSVGLTNKPGVMGMRPIANSQSLVDGDEDQHSDMEVNAMKDIKKVLDLPDDADEAKCVEAIEKLKGDTGAGEFREAVCKAADLDPAKVSGNEEIVTKIHTLYENQKADGDDKAYADAVKRIEHLETELTERRVNSVINEALACGRICESQREEVEEDLRANFDAALRSIQRVPENTFPGTGRVTTDRVNDKSAIQGSRETIIAHAAKEFDDNTELHQSTCRENYVEDALRQAGKPELTEDEKAKLTAG